MKEIPESPVEISRETKQWIFIAATAKKNLSALLNRKVVYLCHFSFFVGFPLSSNKPFLQGIQDERSILTALNTISWYLNNFLITLPLYEDVWLTGSLPSLCSWDRKRQIPKKSEEIYFLEPFLFISFKGIPWDILWMSSLANISS